MRTTAIVIALFLVGSGAITGVHGVAAQTVAGWTTLFNGKNLDNWQKTGNANWRVVDGVIEADMPRGFLLTKESYGDFDLRAEIWVTFDSNGGVLFRITRPVSGDRPILRSNGARQVPVRPRRAVAPGQT